MANEGIVRRIDELGRVVIPKELRRTLHIRDGEELEIIPDGNGGIVMRKFSLLSDQVKKAEVCACAIHNSIQREVYVATKSSVIIACGSAKSVINEQLTNSAVATMEQRRSVQLLGTSITKTSAIPPGDYYIIPILTGGDLYGAIIIKGIVTQSEMIIGGAVANCLIGLLE